MPAPKGGSPSSRTHRKPPALRVVVGGRDDPARPGRKAHNCCLSKEAGGVSDPAAPASQRPSPPPGCAAGAMWGRTLYTVGTGALEAFGLADPARPTLAGWFALGGDAGPVAVDATHVFVATQEAVDIYYREQETAPKHGSAG